MRTPVELLEIAAMQLGSLCDTVVFLGGSVVGLLVTDPASRTPRATDDVDIAVELASRLDYDRLEASLRRLGFQNDMAGPICRFRQPPVVLDVMPTDPQILGFSNRWYPEAIRTAVRHRLTDHVQINLITPACFIATKLEAFASIGREGAGDLVASRDFEDIVVVLDGRPSIVDDVLSADPLLGNFVSDRFGEMMKLPNIYDGIAAHLDIDIASQSRVHIVVQRMQAISKGFE